MTCPRAESDPPFGVCAVRLSMASTCPRAESRAAMPFSCTPCSESTKLPFAIVTVPWTRGLEKRASNRQIEIGSSCHALPGHREHGVGDGKVGSSRNPERHLIGRIDRNAAGDLKRAGSSREPRAHRCSHGDRPAVPVLRCSSGGSPDCRVCAVARPVTVRR